MKEIFFASDIMLPRFISDSKKAEKWAVVACDQYTSEPEYWNGVYSFVGDSESTLNMILPEAFWLIKLPKNLLIYPNVWINI